jgi:indolepyruvate decarboxylase
MSASIGIGDYLISRLRESGVRHVFGIPGDYVLGFNKKLEESELDFITTCDEQGAGFAADAYARLNGLGVVCVTYCVGGLKLANSTAQAYAEKSPVVVISGSPGIGERFNNPLLHHMVKDFDTQLSIFRELTVASTVLDDPQIAQAEIDRVLDAALTHKRPVYIELPRDRLNTPIVVSAASAEATSSDDPHALREALGEAVTMIQSAERPVVIAGVEMHRFGLNQPLMALLESARLPFASTILGKSAVDESSPLYLGLYEGAAGPEDVWRYVESSDCLILLGTFMTDLNLGMYTARLEVDRTIYATSERLSIRRHYYEHVSLRGFIDGLMQADLKVAPARDLPHPPPSPPFVAAPENRMTVKRLFEAVNAFLQEAPAIVIADPGDALFGGADLLLGRETHFLSPAYYTSLGFAVPAAIGACYADPSRRPVVLVGDGAFQMTGPELSTAAKYGLAPIVIILNNAGYGTERPMIDAPFNDVQPWRYSKLPELIGAGRGFRIETEGQLEAALQAARAETEQLCILEVVLESDDISPALQRLTSTLAKRVRSG